MQSAHQTVRSLASSIRSSTLSILFRISACPRARAAARLGPWGAVGAPVGSIWMRNPPPVRATPSPEKKAGPGAAGGDSSPRRILFLGLFLSFGGGGFFFENLYKRAVPGSNQPLCSVVGPTLANACRRMPCGSQSSAWGCLCHVAR